MHGFLRRLGAFAAGRRTRWVVVGVWLGLLVVAVPFSASLQEKAQEEYGNPKGSQSAEIGALIKQHFDDGDTSPALLVYRRAGGLTASDRKAIVDDARSALDVPLVRRAVAPFGPRAGPEQVSGTGEVAFTVIQMRAGRVKETTDSITALRDAASSHPGLEGHLTGTNPLLNDLTNIIQEADAKLLAATGLLVLLLLLFIYRSPLLALVPLLVVGLSYVISIGVVDLLARGGMSVSSSATSLMLVLMFGVGTDYCLMLLSRYRAALRAGELPDAALSGAVTAAAPALIASAATVIAALLALMASSLELNRNFGPVNAIGVAVVLVASLTLLPALLSILGSRAFWPVKSRASSPANGEGEDGIWSRVALRVLRRPGRALALSAGVLVACMFGFLVYTPDANVLKQFRAETDGTRGYGVLAGAFEPGTLAPLTVLVRATRDGTLANDTVQTVRRELLSRPGVAQVSNFEPSLNDSLGRFRLVLEGDPYANATLRQVPQIRNELRDAAAGVDVLVGEGAANRYDYREAVQHDLKVIVPLTLLIILLTLIILLRAIVAPLFLLATVLLSYGATLGLALLFFEYVLDQGSVDPELLLLSFIFLVALGSDYNIFLMSRVREEAARVGTRKGIIRATVATGPVITSAGLVLAGTFFVLTVIPFYFLLELGVTVGFGILLDTFVVRTIVVPAIVTILGDHCWWPFSPPDRKPTESGTVAN